MTLVPKSAIDRALLALGTLLLAGSLIAIPFGGNVGAEQASAGPAKTTNMVTMKDFAFVPAEVRVKAGTEVSWRNDDSEGVEHTASAEDAGGFDTGSIAGAGGVGKAKFDKAGTFAYVCDFHANMKGTVVVE